MSNEDIIRKGDNVAIPDSATAHYVLNIDRRTATLAPLGAGDEIELPVTVLKLVDAFGQPDRKLALIRKIEQLASDIVDHATHVLGPDPDEARANSLYIKHDSATLAKLGEELDDLLLGYGD